MKRITRWLANLLSVTLLLNLLPVTVFAEEISAVAPWEDAQDALTYYDFQTLAQDNEVSAIKVVGDIVVEEDIAVTQNILIGEGVALRVAEEACLTHTGEMFRYEDLELGQANFDRLAEHGVYFLYSQTGEGNEATYHRELYGSAEKAATALLDSETNWSVAILAGDTVLSTEENEETTITATVYAYGNVTVGKNVTLQSGSVSDEGALVKKIYSAEEFAASCGENSPYTDLYIAESITVSGDFETAANIMVATEKELRVAADASLIHTGNSYRYEDLELGFENFERLAEHGVSFLYNPTESGIYRELYGSVSAAAEAMAGHEWNTVILPDAGQDADIILSGENTVTNLNIFDDVILRDDVSLTVENLTAAEGCDVIREVDTLEELKAAAQEEVVTVIRITSDLTVTAVDGVGLTIDKRLEVADNVSLTIYAGEFGCDVSEYVPEGYICSSLWVEEETEQSTNGFDGINKVDNLYVVYKKVVNFAQMKDAQDNPTVGAIYVAGDFAATDTTLTITKPIEIGWNESAGKHYDFGVAVNSILTVTCPYQRFGYEKIGRVGNDNFDEMAEDGICFLMKGNDTRELYGSPNMAQAALEEATANSDPYMMATLLGGTFGAPTYCDCKFLEDEEYGFIHVGSPIQVTGMLICYGHIVMGDNSSLIAQNIWMGGGGPACTSYRHTYVLEGYSGTVTVHGGSSSEGGGGNQSSNVTTSTTTNDDGSVTTTTTNANTGEVTEVTKTPSGVSGTTVTNKDGEVTGISASVPTAAVREAVKNGETVITLPVEVPAAESVKDAVAVKVDIPSGTDSLTLEIPVEDVTSGTVAVIVHADGTEEIVKTSSISGNGVVLNVEEDVTIKIVDNSKEFSDVHAVEHWAEDAIDFVSSRELFNGTTETTFTPNAPTSRAQLMTVLARLDGADTSGSALEKGLDWAVENGISDGTNPSGTISRQQLAVMLWRYAGSPAAENEVLSFTDAEQVSDYAQEAMRWATENGILNGYANGSLNPQGTATRAHVAQMVKNFIQSGVL